MIPLAPMEKNPAFGNHFVLILRKRKYCCIILVAAILSIRPLAGFLEKTLKNTKKKL
jgi:hypothetical protein